MPTIRTKARSVLASALVFFFACLFTAAAAFGQALPAPEAFFGHRIGAEKNSPGGTGSSST